MVKKLMRNKERVKQTIRKKNKTKRKTINYWERYSEKSIFYYIIWIFNLGKDTVILISP